MKKKNIFTGLAFILAGLLLYISLSGFEIEEGSDPRRIVIKKGVVRTAEHVAKELSRDMGFDLEGAYRTGYKSDDIINYLIEEPHDYSVTLYNGKYYEGRLTVLYVIPFSVSIFLVAGGLLIIFSGDRKKKAEHTSSS